MVRRDKVFNGDYMTKQLRLQHSFLLKNYSNHDLQTVVSMLFRKFFEKDVI